MRTSFLSSIASKVLKPGLAVLLLKLGWPLALNYSLHKMIRTISKDCRSFLINIFILDKPLIGESAVDHMSISGDKKQNACPPGRFSIPEETLL